MVSRWGRVGDGMGTRWGRDGVVMGTRLAQAPSGSIPLSISTVGLSISNFACDIEDFDVVCSFDVDVLHLRHRVEGATFDIEGAYRWCNLRYRRSENDLRYQVRFDNSISKVFDTQG
jgi:hypothetical protein